MKTLAWRLVLASLAATAGGCQGNNPTYAVAYSPHVAGGDAKRGVEVIEAYGCGSCHTIPGVRNAKGLVGPPLLWWSRRTFIAGELPNTPENLVRWIQSPQSVEARTAMPTLGLSDQQARDVAAYLYTVR
jgi:cytochrome c1